MAHPPVGDGRSGQQGRESRFQPGWRSRAGDMGDETGVGAGSVDQDDGLVHAGQAGQRCLDLAEFKSLAPDLHLLVDAAAIQDGTALLP